MKGEGGSDPPICINIEPPLLPVSVASDPFKIETMEPIGASISKIALKYDVPKLSGTTLPVTERVPLVETMIVPPVLLVEKAPKLIF